MANSTHYPVLANNGRTVIGHAKSASGAKRLLMKTLSGELLSSVKKHGFTLSVWLREDWIVEVNGGLKGFMYSIGK